MQNIPIGIMQNNSNFVYNIFEIFLTRFPNQNFRKLVKTRNNYNIQYWEIHRSISVFYTIKKNRIFISIQYSYRQLNL